MQKDIKFNIISEGIKNGVSVTCRKYNISRTIYYRWLKRYKEKGIDGLDDIKKDFIPVNKTNPEIESAIFNLIRTYPTYGPRAIKYLLEELDHHISESAVFNIMKRNNLTNKESRLKFAKKKEKKLLQTLPPLDELASGECWVFWITNYGNYVGLGNLYGYTIFDLKSRIACTRIYHEISYHFFEDLLTAVAMPIAQTLNIHTKFLCFFQESKLLKKSSKSFESKINKTITGNRFDVNIHLLNANEDLADINNLKDRYNESCSTFLMQSVAKGPTYKDLKILFQKYVRAYNITNKTTFGNEEYSPVEYHNKITNTKLILPLWAYIDREY